MSDMAVTAAESLFEEYDIDRNSIDYLLLCTQSSDYYLPTTACMVQDRLGLPTNIGALDFDLPPISWTRNYDVTRKVSNSSGG